MARGAVTTARSASASARAYSPGVLLAVHYAEIGLKGRNRPRFESRLRKNIERALGRPDSMRIHNLYGRLLVELPDDIDPAEVFRLARADLELAQGYSRRLHEHGAPRGVVEFTLMPVLLAWATLDRVAERGPGAKLTRPEVRDILKTMGTALDRGNLGELHQRTP